MGERLGDSSRYPKFAPPSRKPNHLAKKMVETNTIICGDYEPISLNEVHCFSEERDRSHQFRFLSLQWLNQIIDARGDEKTEGFFCQIWDEVVEPMMESMINSNVEEPFFMAHHDHSSALRAIVLAKIYVLAKNKQFKNQVGSYIEFSIDFLLKENNYSKLTNHGWDQAKALIICSNILTEKHSSRHRITHHLNSNGFDSEHSLKCGIARFLDELNHAFTSEGVHVENSPSYHIHMINNLIYTMELFKEQCISNDLIIKMDIRAKAGLLFAKMIQRDNMTLPLIGDSYEMPPKLNRYTLDYMSLYNEVEPIRDFHGFPKSGYAIWKNTHNGNSIHLTLKNGNLSTYHRHDDDLSITLNFNGKDLLIDSGLFKYEETHPDRLFLRSSFSHSTIVCDDECVRSVSKSLNNTSNSLMKQFKAYSNMWVEKQFSREITQITANVFQIIDTAESDCDQLKILFHTPGHVEVNDEKEILISLEGVCLKISWVIRGQFGFNEIEIKEIPSKHSRKHGNLESSTIIQVEIPSRQCEYQFTLISESE